MPPEILQYMFCTWLPMSITMMISTTTTRQRINEYSTSDWPV